MESQKTMAKKESSRSSKFAFIYLSGNLSGYVFKLFLNKSSRARVSRSNGFVDMNNEVKWQGKRNGFNGNYAAAQ